MNNYKITYSMNNNFEVIKQENYQKRNINYINTTSFKGINPTVKTKKSNFAKNILTSFLASFSALTIALRYKMLKNDFDLACKQRLDMRISSGYRAENAEAIEMLKQAYIINPKLTEELMCSTLFDLRKTWLEYSPGAIAIIVENNKKYPQKTEILKKCLSNSCSYSTDLLAIKDSVNLTSNEKIQKALVEAGYREDKKYDYPFAFYEPKFFLEKLK